MDVVVQPVHHQLKVVFNQIEAAFVAATPGAIGGKHLSSTLWGRIDLQTEARHVEIGIASWPNQWSGMKHHEQQPGQAMLDVSVASMDRRLIGKTRKIIAYRQNADGAREEPVTKVHGNEVAVDALWGHTQSILSAVARHAQVDHGALSAVFDQSVNTAADKAGLPNGSLPERLYNLSLKSLELAAA